MASTFSTNLHLELQGTGDNSGTWGAVLNSAALTIVDNSMGGVQTLTLSNVPVTISTTQSQKNAYKLTGTLTGNVTITWPTGIGRTYFVANNTTGNFTVTLASAGGGTTATIQQGRNGFFVLDGTNVIAQTDTSVPTGTLADFAASTPPTGYLACDGSAVSRTTYASLFGVIGTVWGAGDGSSTFNLPDFRGYFARGWDNGAGRDPARVFASSQTSQNLSHTHTGTAASHTHSVTASGVSRRGANGDNTGTNWYGSSGDTTQGGVGAVTTGSSGALALTVATDGGTEARPINLAVLKIIKT